MINHQMRAGIGILVVAALGACGSGDPTTIEYDIEFPSTAAAVGADTVQVFVFDRAQPKTDCASLLVARASHAALPAILAQTDQLALCDVLGGGKGQISSVGYGNVSFLAVARHGAADYFTGCAVATLSEDSTAPVPIQLESATTTPIPITTCMSVSDHCRSPPACTVM